MDLLAAARSANPTRLWWCADPAAAELADVRLTLTVYNAEGYETMTHDKVRNERFRLGVEAARRERRWLEIGPGAHALLTRMVLDGGEPNTSVLAIEGNPEACEGARLYLKPYSKHAVRLVQAMSTDPAAVDAILANAPAALPVRTRDTRVSPRLQQQQQQQQAAAQSMRSSTPPRYALIQEVLGLLASSEGVCNIIGRLHLAGVRFSAMVPTRAATFFSPALMDSVSTTSDVYVASGSFALFRKLEINALLRKTAGSGPTWERAGVLEYLDFADCANLMRDQHHVTEFESLTEARVNGLAAWIWCETSAEGAPAQGRFARTAYPYGCTDVPRARPGSVDFSSNADDMGAAATAWRNVFFPFDSTVTLQANERLSVSVDVTRLDTPSPMYQVRAVVAAGKPLQDGKRAREERTVFHTVIKNFYPSFSARGRTRKSAEGVDDCVL